MLVRPTVWDIVKMLFTRAPSYCKHCGMEIR